MKTVKQLLELRSRKKAIQAEINALNVEMTKLHAAVSQLENEHLKLEARAVEELQKEGSKVIRFAGRMMLIEVDKSRTPGMWVIFSDIEDLGDLDGNP